MSICCAQVFIFLLLCGTCVRQERHVRVLRCAGLTFREPGRAWRECMIPLMYTCCSFGHVLRGLYVLLDVSGWPKIQPHFYHRLSASNEDDKEHDVRRTPAKWLKPWALWDFIVNRKKVNYIKLLSCIVNASMTPNPYNNSYFFIENDIFCCLLS